MSILTTPKNETQIVIALFYLSWLFQRLYGFQKRDCKVCFSVSAYFINNNDGL
jgi:hypothetical protein